MALKAVLTLEEYDELDEARQGDYRQNQQKDAWILELEGVDSHPTVSGMATTIRKFKEVAPSAKALKKIIEDADALKTAWDGLDPEDTRESLERLAEIDEGNADPNKPDVKTLVEAAEAKLQRKHDKELGKKDDEITALTGDRDVITGKFTDEMIERELDAGLLHIGSIEGLRDGAKALIEKKYKPIVERSEDDDGKISFKAVIRTELGDESISDFFERWQTLPEADEYVHASGNVGTESRTQDNRKGSRKKNPWSKDHWNLTEQGRILNDNRAAATKMAAEHGHEILASR